MSKQKGFTIVELLIVIVIIGILAALVVAAYNGVQDRAKQSKIAHDQALLLRAIRAARVNSGDVALRYVTLTTGTAGGCVGKANGTDLATLNKATDTCWTNYASALQRISTAAMIDVTDIVDPWGRPYFLDENEGEFACPSGDNLAVYKVPFASGWSNNTTNAVSIPTVSC